MAPAARLNGSATVVMIVNGQAVEMAIDGANAPVTAGNFVDLVERGFYDGISFHRVVRSPDPFVVQAGDPASKDPTVPLNRLGGGSYIDPDTNQARTIPLEIKTQGATEPIYSQTTTQPVAVPHKQGTIAMARAAAPDSASSQFYIALKELPFLDGNYATFGQVTQGFAAVDQIQAGDRIVSAKVVDGVLPSRTSVVLSDATRLNAAHNFLNRADLPRQFTFLGEAAESVTLTAAQSQTTPSGVRGLAGNDTIIGSSAADIVWGDEGNDVISGGDGDDYLRGIDGDDLINGDAGGDFVNGNRGNDTVIGGAGDDFVRGGQGNDSLLGGDGNDVLCGDFGADTLTGGAGADTFLLRTDTAIGIQAASDVVVDFSAAQGDRLGIVGSVTLDQLTLQNQGGSTVIQLPTGQTLATIAGAAPDVVRSALVAVSSSDAVLRL
jgi:peptidyl-prolyl cis-trans isomerase B (cyclophilin B)